MSLAQSFHPKQYSYIHSAASSLSDSTGLVSRLLRCRGGNARACGVWFGENCRLRPSRWRFHLGGHFDRLHWPEGAGYVAGGASAALESWFSVLEDLSVQRAGRFGGGGHHWRGFQRLQGVEDNIWRVLDAALPLQLPQLVQSRVHRSFNVLCNHFRVHGPVVVEALWPPCCHSFPDLRAVYPVLQRWVSADRIEAAVATDGAFVWNLLGKTLAHYGLRWGSGTGYGSWGGWFCHWAT